ncbi:MAG: protein-L-isoaspartate O-methyltransferase [bacterium]|nr:protein-L-isoaspartate O-methyltransferase [bacterium]
MTREELSKFLIRDGYLKTSAIIEAFQKIDRRDFVLSEYAGDAYSNISLPIGNGQSISQPLIVAFMLELLAPQKGEKILEIGSGSGWQTALLAELVGEEGKIVAIEIEPELKKNTENNLEKYGFLEKGIVEIILGDGSLGWTGEAPFDKIIISGETKIIFDDWKNQLRLGGRLIAPVGDSVILLEKIEADNFSEKRFFGFKFSPLKAVN